VKIDNSNSCEALKEVHLSRVWIMEGNSPKRLKNLFARSSSFWVFE